MKVTVKRFISSCVECVAHVITDSLCHVVYLASSVACTGRIRCVGKGSESCTCSNLMPSPLSPPSYQLHLLTMIKKNNTKKSHIKS